MKWHGVTEFRTAAATAGAVLGIACGVLLVSGCATPHSTGGPAVYRRGARLTHATSDESLWVFDAGWHTGLVLSRAEMGPSLAGVLRRSPKARYFVWGWGNRQYYMAARPTSAMGLAALFPSRSVVLVQACHHKPPLCFSPGIHLRVLTVSRGGISRLDDYLAHSLQKGAHGNLQPMAPGPYPHSEFFASGLSYDAFHTCNTWTAEALQAAGLPVSSGGVVFAGQVWHQL